MTTTREDWAELRKTTSNFANLHVHSEGSFLDGFSKVEQIAQRTKELGQSAVAITDHGEVNQHLAFQKACVAEGVKPLLGIEAYWTPDIPAVRAACQGKGNSGKWGKMLSHICLIASNEEGLRNLWALSSTAYDADHFYQRPTADPALLRQYSGGLFASDGCLLTALGQAVEKGDEDAAKQYLGSLHSIYGDRFYVELHTWQYMYPTTNDSDKIKWDGEWITTVAANAKMTRLNQAKVRLATEMGIPMVVVNDSHHAYPEHWKFKELVWGFKADANPDQMDGTGQKADHLMGDDELYFWMDRHGVSRDVVAEAIKYSGHIAEQCNTEIRPMLKMPTFTESEADDYKVFLEHVEAGFRRRLDSRGLDESVYRPRLESEIKLIADKHFAGYFLVVEDVIEAARSGRWVDWVKPGKKVAWDPMDIGPGRGSAGGSLVAYALGITNLDPIKYGLIFERFLTPERQGFPDIDIDFPKSKRGGIKEYTQKRWGEDHVCSICTMTRNKAKGTINDLVRAMGIDYQEGVEISKLIEKATAAELEEDETSEDIVLTWEEVAERAGGELTPYVRRHPGLFDAFRDTFGTIRQTGVHPAAVLISDAPLYEVIPTRVKNGTLTTAFDMYAVEELGGLKMDYLALRHLDALAEARELVKERHGVTLDYEAFGDEQYCDPAIWEQIDEGRTTGIFQLGTPGGTDSAIEFRPRSEREVADLIAINRPGVRDAGLYHVYLRRRAGVEPVEYDHPLMEEIVGETYGILVYQEQLMTAAKVLANFTLVEADSLRKAVSKKVMAKVLAMKGKFVEGCLDNVGFISHWNGDNRSLGEMKRLGSEVAEKIWLSIEASGRYLFNKSHSQGYALVSCTEIWMKHYYPAEMLTGFMRVDDERTNAYVRDARRRKIEILGPGINSSARTFTVGDNSIRYGLEQVRSIGAKAAIKLIKGQPYSNVEDLLIRGEPNKTVALNLARLGALDCFGDRVQVMREIEWYRAAEGLAPSTQGDFDKLAHTVARRLVEGEDYQVEIPDFSDPLVVYNIEQELVGSFITADPMGPYLDIIEAEAVRSPAQVRRYFPGQKLVIGGQIVKVTEHVVKSGRTAGQTMAFLGVQWQGDDYDIVVWPRLYSQYRLLLKMGAPVLVGCERNDRGVAMAELFRLDLINA